MLDINLSNYFLDLSGLYALLALIPFILIYIIKPKPRKLIIPSLMFFIRDKNKNILNSFLQKFFNDFLFYVQFLILVLLAAVIAKPYMVIPSISYADSMVFVIDASASMNAIEDGTTRFEKAKDIVRERIASKNTVILATDTTQILLENADRTETEDSIRNLKPKETESALYDAIVLAENYVGAEDSAIVVVSDFSSERLENEFFRAKSYLESKGFDIFFDDVSKNKARNIGIIDIEVKELETNIWMKNYNDNPETVKVKYGDKEQWVDLEPNDVESLSLSTLNGKSVIEIEAEDDFKVDNKAYISTPQESSIDIMLISNSEEKYLKAALGLMKKINLQENKPPIIQFNNPDLMILGSVNKGAVIPGDIVKIRNLVEDNGVPLIILAQDDIMSIGLGDIFPLEVINNAPVEIEDTIVPSNPDSFLTPSEIQFGIARKVYQTKDNDNIHVYARTSSNQYPVITISTYGKGKILYYGLFDEYSEFKSDIFYPIFWKRGIDFLIGGKSLTDINKKTGYTVFLAKEQKVDTPYGIRKGKSITLDYQGFYDFQEHSVAANLISEEEQRLNRDALGLEESKLTIESSKVTEETKSKEVYQVLVIAIIVLLVFELLYLKFRGDV